MKTKLVILGVIHNQFTKSQLKVRRKKNLFQGGNLPKLLKKLKELRKKGAKRLGSEVYLEKIPPVHKIPSKKISAWRYFRTVCREAKKMGYEVFDIEDIPAHQLGKIIFMYPPEEVYAWIRPLLKEKWKKDELKRRILELEYTINHYRTICMIENAQKIHAEVMVVGSYHARFSDKKKCTIILIDKKWDKKRDPAPTFYSRYAYLIPPLLKKLRKSKMFKKLKKDWPAYTERKF